MQIKLRRNEVVYSETQEKYIFNVNGKKVIAFYYEKQDPEFCGYETDIEIQNEGKLTEDEQDAVKDYITFGGK